LLLLRNDAVRDIRTAVVAHVVEDGTGVGIEEFYTEAGAGQPTAAWAGGIGIPGKLTHDGKLESLPELFYTQRKSHNLNLPTSIP
jgi:hypothetical protein